MDIVERLRDMQGKKYRSDWATWVQTQCSEAAAEIERLRGTLKAQDVAHHAEVQEQTAAERERCAKICDVTPPHPFRASIEAAHAIRNQKPNCVLGSPPERRSSA